MNIRRVSVRYPPVVSCDVCGERWDAIPSSTANGMALRHIRQTGHMTFINREMTTRYTVQE